MFRERHKKLIDSNEKEVYLVMISLSGEPFEINMLHTRKEAEEWIKQHRLYKLGNSFFIQKATKWQKEKKDVS